MGALGFQIAKEWLAGNGFDVGQARYDEAAFGSWVVEARHGGRAFRVVWEGRDGWLVVQRRAGAGAADWVDACVERSMRDDGAIGEYLEPCFRGMVG